MLAGVTAFVGTESHVFIDEAAHYAQIDLVEGGTWLVERPFAAQDLTGEHAPMDRAQLSGSAEYAPFVNHPLSVWIGVAAQRLGGQLGIRAVSVLGAVGAAAAAAALAERFRRGTGPLALWLTGVASPLAFDSQLIVHHALAAAVVGAAAVLWSSRRPAVFVASGLAAASFVTVLLRSEAMLLAIAVGLVGGAVALRRREGGLAARAGATLIGAFTAYVIEPVWIERIVDAPDVGPRTISSSSRGGLEGQIEALRTVLFRPSYAGLADQATDVLLLLAVVLAAVGVVLALRGNNAASRPLLVMAVASALVRLADPTVTPGLLLAFPALLTAAALLILGVHRPRGHELGLVAVAALFAGAVAATQYDEAGGFEWGWRYVSIAVPLVVPTVAVALRSAQQRLGGRRGTEVIGAVVAMSVLITASGLVEQRAIIDRTDTLLHRIESESVDADNLLFLDPLLGRAMWQLSLDGRAVYSDPADSGEVLGWMRQAGARDVVLVWVGSGEVPIGGGGYEIGPVTDLGVSGLRAALLHR